MTASILRNLGRNYEVVLVNSDLDSCKWQNFLLVKDAIVTCGMICNVQARYQWTRYRLVGGSQFVWKVSA